ncbi:MAG TPA: AbrB/MazE/SpoVT family DNA-binding domain-containing protein [Acidimicrobiales bacterium]|nr:AbrB/MazE/SpoVT family DNA-binding domain-containing protein [Acidimicrobiales bacterium]
MRTTIDAAGRLVVPKRLRDEVGLRAGNVEVSIDGNAIRIEPVAGDDVVKEAGFEVIPPTGTALDDDTVRTLRDAGQR